MKEKILFIDDEQENLDGFYFTFTKYFNITLALSAYEAIEILKKENFKVIISDNRMKGLTGIEFFSNNKNLFNNAILIILTAYSESDEIIEAINRASIYRYLLKPWDAKDLKMTIESAIQAFNLDEHNKELIDQLEKKNVDLNEALLKAKESDALKLSFINNISHEIRTPMNGIIGFSDIIKNQNLPASFNGYINIIQQSSEQLLNIMDGILEFSVLMNEKINIKKTEVKLHAFMSDLYKDYSSKNNDKVTFLLKNCDQDFVFFTDRIKLKMVLSKLLNNAFKYTDNGQVSFGVDLNEETLLFYVKDTGIGVDKSIEKNLFDPFIKMEILNNKYNQGIGLGLSIAQVITQKLNGNLWFETDDENQTCFYCKIPVN